MGLFDNISGNRRFWEAEIGQGGGAVFSARINRGEYDHRKAERGQNAFGAGGREVRGEDHAPQRHKVDCVKLRAARFAKRKAKAKRIS